MKCRNIIRNGDGTYNIVWFKSVGSKSIAGLQDEYATLPIVRGSITAMEYPNMICGFTDVSNTGATCAFSAARPDLQQFSLIATAAQGQDVTISFYNTNDPSEVFYTKTFTTRIDLIDYITTGYSELKNLTLKVETSNFSTISQFLLKLYGVSEAEKAENYVEDSEAVSVSLIQRLSVIKNELWYSINYGLPLLDKVRNKAIIDAAIIKIINGHEGVQNIIEYKSGVEQKNHTYYFTANIATIYNQNISISSEYLI